MHMRRIVIFGLPGSTSFFKIIFQTSPFSKKVTELKMRVFILSITFV